MKIQDIIFVLTLVFLLYKHNSYWLVVAGIVCLIISIPLFSFWIFFTAERLTWYAAGFFLLAIIFYIFNIKKYESDNP